MPSTIVICFVIVVSCDCFVNHSLFPKLYKQKFK